MFFPLHLEERKPVGMFSDGWNRSQAFKSLNIKKNSQLITLCSRKSYYKLKILTKAKYCLRILLIRFPQKNQCPYNTFVYDSQ
jgi:hypothetical protein